MNNFFLYLFLFIGLANDFDAHRNVIYKDMDEALQNIEHVYKLNLSRKKLDSLPHNLFKLKNLEYLDLSKNRLDHLPNELGGSTTIWEMAHMGRKTISKNQGNLPNVINFTDLKSIINTIKNEEKKIGTIQKEVAEETKKCMVNNKDWLNVKFWEK